MGLSLAILPRYVILRATYKPKYNTIRPVSKTQKLQDLIASRRVVRRDDILKVLETNTWMTAYRYLKKLDYVKSFSHACSYYTLRDIPEFDENGLWFFGEVSFSRWGNLQETLKHLILDSKSGHTHEEVQQLLKTRAHNALLTLVGSTDIAREKSSGVYVYVSPSDGTRNQQTKERRKSTEAGRIPRSLIIDILAQTIHLTVGRVKHIEVAKSLRRRGTKVTNGQVFKVFKKYGLEKKTLD